MEDKALERELGWDDEITKDSESFEPLPEGDYNFTIDHFERSRSKGSDKLPPCNMAVVYVTVHGPDRDITIKDNIVLHSKLEWKISQLFVACGLKKEGETIRMNWNALPGCSGRCHVVQEPGMNDPSKKYNRISAYHAPGKAFEAGRF